VREALRDAMAEEMRRDDTVFVMGEEVAEYQGAYKITQGLLDEFGAKRVVDTPITEHGFAGLGVGAAFGGLRPIVEFMTFNFAMQAIDQIINSAAKTLYMSGGQMGAPMVFRGPNGAAARVARPAQPGLRGVVCPCPRPEGGAALFRGRRQGPSENRDPRPQPGDLPRKRDPLRQELRRAGDGRFHHPLRQGAHLARRATDVTIVSFGIGMTYALEAAEKLARDGIEAEVIDLRTLRPIDYDTVIASVMKTNRCVTVEEGWPVCSIGNHLSAYIMTRAFDYLDAPVLNCTGKDVPMPYAANLEKLALTSTKEVLEAVNTVTYR
jgi:pyruvate dehydrogenase E1 component beta subunit